MLTIAMRRCTEVAGRSAIDACRFVAAKYQGLHGSPAVAEALRVYWWEGLGPSLGLGMRGRGLFARNFGDLLSPLVVSLVSGRPVTHAVGAKKLVAIGSVFFGLKDHDLVWGAGVRRPEDVAYALTAKNVVYAAVRGPRTRHLLIRHGLDCPQVFGDPATLLPLYVSNDVPSTVEIGLVPHWTQYAAAVEALAGTGVKVIDVLDGVDAVARQILSCRAIFSTSLHGLIFAEAYGIPAMLLVTREMRSAGLLKFADYFESTDREFGARHVSDPRNLLSLVDELAIVPRPVFNRRALLEGFPLSRATAGPPALSWSRGVCG